MVFKIALASPGDVLDLSRLHAEALPPGWSAEEISAYCEGKKRRVLKATRGAELCGLLILQIAADEAEILTIGVRYAVRRQGVATQLMKKAIRICRQNKVDRLYLEVACRNEPARKFYEKLGFAEFGRRRNYYRSATAGAETAIIMRLQLAAIACAVDLEERSI